MTILFTLLRKLESVVIKAIINASYAVRSAISAIAGLLVTSSTSREMYF